MGSKPKVPAAKPFVRGSVAQFNADGPLTSLLSSMTSGSRSPYLSPKGSGSLLSTSTAGSAGSNISTRTTLGGL